MSTVFPPASMVYFGDTDRISLDGTSKATVMRYGRNESAALKLDLYSARSSSSVQVHLTVEQLRDLAERLIEAAEHIEELK